MSRSYKNERDDARALKRADRLKREARKGEFFTPTRVTRATRHASPRSVDSPSGR